MAEFLTAERFGLATIVVLFGLVAYRGYSAARSRKRAVAGACARCGRLVPSTAGSEDGPVCEDCHRVTERHNRFGMYFFGAMTAANGLVLVHFLLESLRQGRNVPWDTVRFLGLVVAGGVWIVFVARRSATRP
jgi:hypothetical protein